MFQRIIAVAGLFVTLNATAREVVGHQLTASDFPEAWRSGSNGANSVQIDSKLQWDSVGIGAYLDADHFIRSAGLQPQLDASEKTVGKMRLMTLDQSVAESKIARAMARAPDAMYGIAVNVNGTLDIVGRTAGGVRDAIAFFAIATSRNLCIETVCLGRSSIKDQATPQPAKGVSDNDAVWQLGLAGTPNGWSAKGEGTKQFRFLWHRPASWDVLDSPTLRLHVAATASTAVDLQQSAITVRTNGRPIATYSVAQWHNGVADIRIPRELWKATVWDIEIETLLKRDISKNPIAIPPEVAWVHIGPETTLRVPHRKLPYQGIANFYDKMTASGVLRLQSGNFNPSTLARITPLLYPFAVSTNKEEPPRRWQIADAVTCQKNACVQIVKQPGAHLPLTLSDHVWKDVAGHLGMPDIESDNTVAMFYIPADVNHTESLQMVVAPTTPNAPNLSSPDYTGLIGQVALFAGNWHILDVQMNGLKDINNPLQASSTQDNNLSMEQRRLRLLNFIWAAVSVLLIAGLLFWFWRKPKNRQPDEYWELH